MLVGLFYYVLGLFCHVTRESTPMSVRESKREEEGVQIGGGGGGK